MLFYSFVIIAVAATFAVADEEDDFCYNVKELYDKTKPIHDMCRKESTEKSHGDKDACYLNYRFCHLRTLGLLNEAEDGVDHEKVKATLIRLAKEDKKNAIADDVEPCASLEMHGADKIQPYFDCVEEHLKGDCPELTKYRKEFQEEFEGSATDIC